MLSEKDKEIIKEITDKYKDGLIGFCELQVEISKLTQKLFIEGYKNQVINNLAEYPHQSWLREE